MSEILTRDEVERIIDLIPTDMEYGYIESTRAILAHDAALRLALAEATRELAEWTDARKRFAADRATLDAALARLEVPE